MTTRRWPGSASGRARPPVHVRPHANAVAPPTTTPGARARRPTPTAAGTQLRPQTTPRGIGVLFSLAATRPSTTCPSFAPLRALDIDRPPGRYPRPRRAGGAVAEGAAGERSSFDRMYLMTPDSGAVYEFGGVRFDGRPGRRQGHARSSCTSTRSTPPDGVAVVNWPVLNEDFDAIGELLADPVTIMGLADAARTPPRSWTRAATFFLSHWVRDRGTLTLEDGVRRLTRTPPCSSLPRPRGAAGWRLRRRQRARPRRHVAADPRDRRRLPGRGSSSTHRRRRQRDVNGQVTSRPRPRTPAGPAASCQAARDRISKTRFLAVREIGFSEIQKERRDHGQAGLGAWV